MISETTLTAFLEHLRKTARAHEDSRKAKTLAAVGVLGLSAAAGIAASGRHRRALDDSAYLVQARDNLGPDLAFRRGVPSPDAVEVHGRFRGFGNVRPERFGSVSLRRKGPEFLLEVTPDAPRDTIGRKMPGVLAASLSPFSTSNVHVDRLASEIEDIQTSLARRLSPGEVSDVRDALRHTVTKHRWSPLRWLGRIGAAT